MKIKTRRMKAWAICWMALAASALFAETPLNWSEIGIVTTTSAGKRLTLTNGVTRTVQFTDALGDVELDLNGHSITGATGLAGVKVLHVTGGTGTHLRIVDSLQSGTAMVCGGDGINGVSSDSNGAAGGVGGTGVEVATDASGVLVSVGAKVTVKGGAGGAGGGGYSGGSGGSGGSGVGGDVNENSGTISGGAGGVGGHGFYYGGAGGWGGNGVKGSVATNAISGAISGGSGGGGGNGDENGGAGGAGGSGVRGSVGANRGTIASASGSGGGAGGGGDSEG